MEKQSIDPKILRIALEQTQMFRERDINARMVPGRYKGPETAELILKIIQQDAVQITDLGNFYLEETSTWFKGILLERLVLFLPEGKGKIPLLTIYDIDSQQFRFCEELKPTRRGEGTGFKLEGVETSGHELFFKKATREQQQTLLLKASKATFEIRQNELAPDSSVA